MSLETSIADLLEHMQWADALIWKTVLASPAAVADANLHDRLYHAHMTQHAFLQVWRGVSASLPMPDTLDTASLAEWARSFYAEATTDKLNFNEDALNRPVPDSLLNKAKERLGVGTIIPTISDTVLQVVTHSTYHRGQINTRLRELGCEPPLTEYFVWVWHGKPAADWP